MERGRLKIFFGYSAGVGKTYAMLKAARALKAQGADVVLGYLEPHDRPDTLQMAEGLETIPLKTICYQNVTLREFDVDAAMLRRPAVLLVDELAHTNAPGSKNKKRYLDVEELVNSGIEVWTTVNVQHIESLHDLVDAATSVDVNERIPDEIFDYADEVVLIDLEPAELIDRLRAGKIYGKSRAADALENFFRCDHLSSLRELLMRRSADRIEKINNNGALKTKILVLISPSPSSEKNIRVAARMAEAYHCRFSAMYVERNGDLDDDAAANLKDHMRLVRDLGGEIVVKYGEDVVDTVADYVRLAGVTDLVVGKTWQSVGKKVGLEEKCIARLPNIEILIVPDNRRFPYRPNALAIFCAKLFAPAKLAQKYKTANRTLDTFRLLAQEAYDAPDPRRCVADVLAHAFSRSCAVIGNDAVVGSLPNEDGALFTDEKERVVAEWCRKNNRSAGRGTDSLRNAKAIYLPISTAKGICAIGFSCVDRKFTVTETLIFHQLEPLLRLLLTARPC